MYRDLQFPDYQPLVSTGNGNCLYNSVSTILFGCEDFAASLRLASLLHAVKHFEHYLAMVGLVSHQEV